MKPTQPPHRPRRLHRIIDNTLWAVLGLLLIAVCFAGAARIGSTP